MELCFVECPGQIHTHHRHPGEHGEGGEVAKVSKEDAASGAPCSTTVVDTEEPDMYHGGCDDVGDDIDPVHLDIFTNDNEDVEGDEETTETDTANSRVDGS